MTTTALADAALAAHDHAVDLARGVDELAAAVQHGTIEPALAADGLRLLAALVRHDLEQIARVLPRRLPSRTTIGVDLGLLTGIEEVVA